MDKILYNRTLAKVAWRLIPFTMLLFVVNYLNRANIGFAALEMNKDLSFGPAIYGLGAGIFFIGYFCFEIPSNLILHRVGARRWIARIMVTWGLVAAAMAWVEGPKSFYAMRFLLGLAEAGFFPGILLYFSYWFPVRERGRVIGTFMTATAIANIVSPPLSFALMNLDGWFGLHGWQVMFLLEGVPAVLLGFVVLFFLTDRPEDATWLGREERDWLVSTMASEHAAIGAKGGHTTRHGLTDLRVLHIAVLGFCFVSGMFSVIFWLPQIVKSFGQQSNLQVGFLTALPYLLAVFAMVYWGRHSDRTQDRKWHLAAAAVVASGGLAGSALAGTPILSFIGLCVGTVGLFSMFGVFWALPAEILTGSAAAAGFALINSISTLGGFCGPYLFGFVRERTQSFTASLLVLAGFIFASAVLACFLRRGDEAELAAIGAVEE